MPSFESSATRVALLSMFDQPGLGLVLTDEPTRSRPNRRHPDVGYVANDHLCLECVLALLAPAPPEPKIAEVSLPPAPKAEVFLPVAPAPVENHWIVVQPPAQPLFFEPVVSPVTESVAQTIMTSIEISPVTPIQTPGPLGILGVGAGFRVSRQLRSRIRKARSLHSKGSIR